MKIGSRAGSGLLLALADAPTEKGWFFRNDGAR